ncbi:phospholipase D-like domain-containing protein [Vibrio parahaemolyticus]
MEIYFKNIVRRWKSAAINAEQLIMLSPYITSPSANTVINNVDPRRCEVYTLFSAELFASGSSSIDTLIELKESGVNLYSLERLHAKVVLVPDKFASIGSQNLTLGGTHNLESSVVVEQKFVSEVESLVKKWTVSRSEITLDMLIDMKNQIAPFLKQYKSLKMLLEEVDTKTKDNELQRRKQETAKLLKERIRKLNEALKKASKSKRNTQCKVTRIVGEYFTIHYSLTPKRKESLVSWLVDGSVVELEKANRYICMVESSGKLGWARVFKTRITYFSDSVYINNGFEVANVKCDVKFVANWNSDDSSESNLLIKLSPLGSNKFITCRSWFGLDSLIINDISFDDGVEDTKVFNSISTWIKDNEVKFSELIVRELLSPFKYNNKLLGVGANEFFGKVGTEVNLSLSKYNNNPLLVAKI